MVQIRERFHGVPAVAPRAADEGLTNEALIDGLAARVVRLAELTLETRRDVARLLEAVVDLRRVVLAQEQEIRRLYGATAGLAARAQSD